MQHAGWDITDKRWIRLDYIWLISGQILIWVQPLEQLPPIRRSPKCSRSVSVDELRIGPLPSGSLRILARVEDQWEPSVYSGTYWYGLYTGPVEENDEKEQQTDDGNLQGS